MKPTFFSATRRWITALMLLWSSTFATAQVYAPADILWVIDRSGSMGNDINEVKARVQDFHNAMTAAGIDARYGLVRFGGTNQLIQNITTFDDFNRAGGPFRSLTDNGGGTERGSAATVLGLRQATFRQGSVINVILVTDEDDDSSSAEAASAVTELRSRGALFNYIGVPGVGNSDARYGSLASSFHGRAFRIVDFRANPQPFFESFIQTKVTEIVQALQCDVDRDADVDRVDIAAIMAARNQAAASLADPRDADRDGIINVLDARKCALRCTRASCEVGVPNLPPLSNAGPNIVTEVAVVTTLDGRGSSDPNGDPLGYTWTMISAPVGSTVQLANADSARPTFTPDLTGFYNFSLTVTDGRANSEPASVTVQATPQIASTSKVVGHR